MGKRSNSMKPESYGRGKVSSVQIAIIVDRYLSDNNYAQARSNFRTEASDLFSRSTVQEAPKSLLSLADILDEYIQLKEHKVMVQQEKSRLEQDRVRIQSLLSGVQNAMNSYSSDIGCVHNYPSTTISSPCLTQSNANSVMRMDLLSGSPAGYPAYHSPNPMMPGLKPNTSQMQESKTSTAATNQSSKRKRCTKNVADPYPHIPSKRTRCPKSTIIDLTTKDNTVDSNPINVNDGQMLSVTSICNGSPKATSISNTPPRSSTASQTDNSISPVEISSTNCIVIMTPNKKVTYYSIERNHSIAASSDDKTDLRLNKRDHVKGRLDFDDPIIPMDSNIISHDVTSTSEPDNGSGEDAGGRILDLDLDLPEFEDMGLDLSSIGDLVVDFDMDIDDFLGEQGSLDVICNMENSDLFSELVTDIDNTS